MYRYNVDLFLKGLEELNISLTENQINQFLDYYDMLIEKNKVMNLTAVTDFDEVIEKHFLDSLSLIKVVSQDKINSSRFLDLGTGAGFPGIPLKIAFPKMEIVLLDSLNKRINFLNDVINELGLVKISAFHGRAEEYARKADFRESFDFVISRAVANLSTLSEYCLPYVKIGGQFISYKSGEVEVEVKEAKGSVFLVGGKVSDVIPFNLPFSEAGRSFVVIDKVKGTPKAYPRKAGTPAKNPLK